MNAIKDGGKEHNLKSSKRFYQYEIQPVEGREWIQQHFISLPFKAANYSNRHITLNERISIIERVMLFSPPVAGYQLVPVLQECARTKVRQVRLPLSVPSEAKTVASRTPDDEPINDIP